MTRHQVVLGVVTTAALALPSVAAAHVTIHPNRLPEGSYVKIDVRVPNESDDADTTKVALQLPPGMASVSVEPPAGWKVDVKKTKLDEPIKTDDGEITEGVSEIDFSGTLPPGQFVEFPLSIATPGKAGDTLTFKAVQTYSDGEVARWIGAPDAEKPAPTVQVSDKGGVVEDSTGEGGATTPAADSAQPAAVTRVVERKSSNGLAIAALVVAVVAAVAAAGAFAQGRRRPA